MELQNEKIHLIKVVHALIITTYEQKLLWGDAILISFYLINRMPSHILLSETPLHNLKKKVFLRLVSSMIFFSKYLVPHIHTHNQSKLDPKALKYIFIEYSPTKKGYKYYNTSTKRGFISLDVTFSENTPYYKNPSI